MTFEEYLQSANLALDSEKTSRLEGLYTQKQFEEFNRLLLEQNLRGATLGHMDYQNIKDLLGNELKVFKYHSANIAEVPGFIQDVESYYGAITKTDGAAGEKFHRINCKDPEVITHQMTGLGRSISDALGMIEAYCAGERVSIVTRSEDGEEFYQNFKSHEDVTKKY